MGRRALRWGARLVVLAAAVVTVYLGVTLAQVWWASRIDGARAADAIVVLGAAQYDGRPSAVLAARLDHALDLWQDDLAPYIVVTGGRQDGDRFTEATASARYLLERGVPDEAILREVDGTNTWESLAAAARFLRQRDLTSVVLVSDPYHALRVEQIASGLGLDAAVSATTTSPTDGFDAVRAMLRETLAVGAGRIIGYDRLLRFT